MSTGFENKRHLGQGKLQGKSLIVTGGGSHFGLLVAQALVQEGASVLLSVFSEQKEAMFVDPGYRPDVPALVWASGDPRDPNYCQAITQFAIQIFGHLDGLVNNADFEFNTLWSSQTRFTAPPLSFLPFSLMQPAIHVFDNFYQSITEFMRPGSAIIHTLSSDFATPPRAHPVLPGEYGRKTQIEPLLIRQGIRVMALRVGQTWFSGLFDHYPFALSEEQSDEFQQLTQNYIRFLVDE